MATVTETKSEGLYEGMFLVDSARFASDTDGVTRAILDILERVGATVVAHRPWLDGKLAYEIQRRRKGTHYLVYFRMPGRGNTELTRECKLSDIVIRHIVINHPQKLFDAMVGALKGTEPAEESESGAGAG